MSAATRRTPRSGGSDRGDDGGGVLIAGVAGSYVVDACASLMACLLLSLLLLHIGPRPRQAVVQ